MNFNLNSNTALVIIGQLRLEDGQTVEQKMKYHTDNFKYDKLYCFLWDDEYELYHEEMEKFNPTFIVADHKIKEHILNEYQLQCADYQLRQYDAYKCVYINKDPLNYEREKEHIKRYMIFFYMLQYTFRNIKEKHTKYIKTRYDNVYFSNYQKDVKKCLSYLHDDNEKPIILAPIGGDADNIGISDLLTTFNQPAADIYANFLDELILNLVNKKGTPSPEKAFKFIFRNLHNSEIYRFCTGCTTQRMHKDNYICHPTPENMINYLNHTDPNTRQQLLINNFTEHSISNIHDTSYLPEIKAPEHMDILFDLPLLKN